MPKRQDETPDETPGELVPQPHGGALYRGPAPGRKRSGGRTPSALRKLALKKGPKMLKVLEDIALSKEAKDSDRATAAKEHLRIGMSGSMLPLAEVRRKLQATIIAAQTMLPEEHADNFVFELRRIWAEQ